MKKSKNKGKGASKGEEPSLNSFRLNAKSYFITYKGTTGSGDLIKKSDLANYLMKQNPIDRKKPPEKYLICEQMYDSGQPHFHAILIYPQRKEIRNPDFYDYLGIHPNIQIMRNMKSAIPYLYKEDPHPCTNMDVVQELRVSQAQKSSSLYEFLEQNMKKDPLNFDPLLFCHQHDLTKQIYKANYSKAIRLLKDAQRIECNRMLYNKPGFKYIDRALIEQKLSPSELKTYDSWKGYQKIVNHLNIMVKQGGARQQKSMNLLITGEPSVGKTALLWQRNPLPGRTSIFNHCAVYPMGMKDWFPDYKSDVYQCIMWNEARLTDYSYNIILQLLDGSPVMLPAKGGGHKKIDNPLIIMTSNMTLDQMIQQKFSYSPSLKEIARKNLAVRIENVIVPKNRNLFLLQKLMVPHNTPPPKRPPPVGIY